MDDLFSHFQSKPSARTESEPQSSKGKRRADGVDASSSATKKPRVEESSDSESSESEDEKPEQQPIVADSFETQADRQVVASSGLQGGAAQASNGSEETISLSHQVRHQTALPPNYPSYIPLSQHVAPEKPAREYPFTLDPFQQLSVASIQRNESVLVSAHTSAGKTVVAEYAIAQCLQNKQRVIYTSPIKALSNQKYREMQAEFGDVGLMTGDVTINPTASCLVMTTEILRSMLYRGSEIMREVAWVVFDEIHYMRDKERGVVWEETIILLPDTVRYVFLSATIPNAMEFADWICKIHNQPVHVVYTDFRPTPLQHYLFPAGGDGIHLVVDEKSTFRDDNFQKAMGSLGEAQGEDPADPNAGRKKGKSKKGKQKGPSDIYKIIKMLMTKNYSPVIVFAFAKRECEANALQMSKLEFNTADEQKMVEEVFNNAISALAEEDRKLPQIEHILPLLKRGIGIHHGGLLPILKEVIEILFQEGLIKCLCATETFSIGLNMPAKTVVFTNVRKFDGKEFRVLSGGEYIQMSGRAGRRGLDDRGIVVMMVDEKLDPASAKAMVKGETDRLDSAFHLGYNMILNLMRVEGISPEFMLERSFYQFQSATHIPQFQQEMRDIEAQKAAIQIKDEDQIADYYNMRKQLDTYQRDVRDVISHPTYALPFLQPGRLVQVEHDGVDWGWGVVVNYQKRVGPRNQPLPPEEPPQNHYIVDVLLNITFGTAPPHKSKKPIDLSSSTGPRPCAPGEKGEFAVLPVLLSTISNISHIRTFLEKDLRTAEARDKAFKVFQEVKKKFPTGIPLLDPVKNMGITDEAFTKLLSKIESLEDRLAKNKLVTSPDLPKLYDQYSQKMELVNRIKQVKKKMSAAENVIHLEELKQRKRVLRRLGFATDDDVVEMKGRVACEISSGDELLLTDLVFNGVFNDLTPEQCAALLSCFVFDEESKTTVNLKTELAVPLKVVHDAARRVARVCIESKLPLDEEEYVKSFKTELMDVVYQWCKGAKFAEICKMTDVFEGSLIRAFRRLQELVRQMAMAAKAIGNAELEVKFTKCLECLERPNSVVFVCLSFMVTLF